MRNQYLIFLLLISIQLIYSAWWDVVSIQTSTIDSNDSLTETQTEVLKTQTEVLKTQTEVMNTQTEVMEIMEIKTSSNLTDVKINICNESGQTNYSEVDSIKCSNQDSFPELQEYYLNHKNSDITFVIDGIEFPGHKLILCAKSPVFSEEILLRDNSINTNDGDNRDKFFMYQTDVNAFKSMLQFFYYEKFIINNRSDINMTINVYDLATKYQVKRLGRIIEQSMIDILSPENFIKIFDIAVQKNMESLKSGWRRFVRENSDFILENMSYLAATNYTMECILISIKAKPSKLIDAIKTINEWKRHSDIKRFSVSVKLEDCTVDDLLSLKSLNLFSTENIFQELLRKFSILHNDIQKLVESNQYNLNRYENLKSCLKYHANELNGSWKCINL